MDLPGGSQTRGTWQRIALVLLSILVLVLLGVILFGWFRDFVIYRTFSHVAGRFVALGLPPNLVKGILVVVLVPFFLACQRLGKVPLMKGMGSGLPRGAAWAIVVLYVSAYFLAQYWAGRGALIEVDGKALKAFAILPPDNEVLIWDLPGTMKPGERIFHPSGVEGRVLTPELLPVVVRLQRGDVPKRLEPEDPSKVEFFDPLTGTVRVWFHRGADGSIELFTNGPGFFPGGSEPLEPMTAAVRAELVQRQQSATTERAAEAERAAAAAEKAEAEKQQAKAAAAERAARDRYLNADSRKDSSRRNVAILVLGPEQPGLRDALASALRARGYGVTEGLFRPAFQSDGSAGRMMDGDLSIARRFRLAEQIDAVVSLEATTGPVVASDVGEGLQTAAVMLKVKCVDVARERICGADVVQLKGAGFSPAEATRGAIRNAAPELKKIVDAIGL